MYLDNYTDGSHEIVYQFAHDNIQKAFYLLIDEKNKEKVHYKVGQLLLKKAKEGVPELLANNQQISEQVFEIVKHLNIGIKYIKEELGRNELAKLNLLAGKKAKASAATMPQSVTSNKPFVCMVQKCLRKTISPPLIYTRQLLRQLI